MFKHLTLTAAALATALTGLAATPAAAQRYDHRRAYDEAYREGYNRDDDRRGYSDRGYGDRGYSDRGYRDSGRYDDRRYDQRRYDDRRYYSRSRRCNGSTGTIVGAIAGGLLGNAIAGRGDRTLGAVLGAGGGALAGRAVDRDGCR